MSEKKSFILYDDMATPVETLSNEEAGKLFKHIFAYRNNTNSLSPLEGGGAMAFEFIKQQIGRDSDKWENRAERSRKNGSKGGRPVITEKPRKPSGLFDNPENPVGSKKPVNVNVTVNGNVNVKEKNPNYVEMVDLLISKIEENDPKYFNGKNKKAKRNNWYDPIRKLIEIDGRTLKEVKDVINWCQDDEFWKSNVLSTSKLREKFPSFIIKLKPTQEISQSMNNYIERQKARGVL